MRLRTQAKRLQGRAGRPPEVWPFARCSVFPSGSRRSSGCFWQCFLSTPLFRWLFGLPLLATAPNLPHPCWPCLFLCRSSPAAEPGDLGCIPDPEPGLALPRVTACLGWCESYDRAYRALAAPALELQGGQDHEAVLSPSPRRPVS